MLASRYAGPSRDFMEEPSMRTSPRAIVVPVFGRSRSSPSSSRLRVAARRPGTTAFDGAGGQRCAAPLRAGAVPAPRRPPQLRSRPTRQLAPNRLRSSPASRRRSSGGPRTRTCTSFTLALGRSVARRPPRRRGWSRSSASAPASSPPPTSASHACGTPRRSRACRRSRGRVAAAGTDAAVAYRVTGGADLIPEGIAWDRQRAAPCRHHRARRDDCGRRRGHHAGSPGPVGGLGQVLGIAVDSGRRRAYAVATNVCAARRRHRRTRWSSSTPIPARFAAASTPPAPASSTT